MMATKEPMNSGEEKKEDISIETQKVIQGISLVFTGAVTMLEALHPRVSLEPSALLHLVTGNADKLYAFSEEKRTAESEKGTVVTKTEEKDETKTAADGVVGAASATVPDDGMGGATTGVTETPLANGKQESESPAATLTVDDITKIIVQKIKQNRANSEKIGQILKNYGVAKVSELPASRYEAFVTDLSAI